MSIRMRLAGFGLRMNILKYICFPLMGLLFFVNMTVAANSSVVTELTNIQGTLMQVGPALSAMMFVLAGIFYAIGQMLPAEKKANFHTAAVNIIIGAIVVGVLSVASTSLAVASTHLLGNLTTNSSV
jgi:sorbitol-specific phosphotransferase system component IIC